LREAENVTSCEDLGDRVQLDRTGLLESGFGDGALEVGAQRET
jgi:hypothetical protein